jgi:hypothetical protein
MELRTIIYTTNPSRWIEHDFPEITRAIHRTKGVTVHSFTVQTITLPQSVPTYSTPDGGRYVDWQWIRERFPAGDHNAVCLHISQKERDQLGLLHPDPSMRLGGVYSNDRDPVFDFVVIADYSREWVRIFLHELSHGFAHWTGVPDRTHEYDYERKDVPAIFRTYSFEVWTLWKEALRLTQLLFNRLTMKSNAQKLYDAAVAALGTDASPNDLAPDELGCAETVSSIIRKVLPDFPVITGTATLWERFISDGRFTEVTGTPQAGDIIISPTQPQRPFPGHTGIFLGEREIASNDSRTGTFAQNYVLNTWKGYYGAKGGYPVYIYRLKN